MSSVTYPDDTVGSRIGRWLGLTVLAVVAVFVSLLFLFIISMADDPLPVWVCLTYQALLVASGLLFLGSFVPLFWRAPIGAVRFGVGYLVVLVVYVAWQSIS